MIISFTWLNYCIIIFSIVWSYFSNSSLSIFTITFINKHSLFLIIIKPVIFRIHAYI